MKTTKWFLALLLAAFISLFTGCANEDDISDGGGGSGGGGGSSSGSGGTTTPAGSTRERAILVTIGNSSTHTITSSGEHWFKFEGNGDPVIFETSGNVVDTYIERYNGNSYSGSNDNGGEGVNALYSFTTTSGTTYYIKITTRSSTSGTYTFLVKSPTSNLRTNPITVAVGNSSSHTINSNGTHWFKFTGTGNRVFFETGGDVVDTDIRFYKGDNTSYFYSGKNKVNFFPASGETYYISITGNSGTYTFNVRSGDGDASSQYNAKTVTKGYSSSYNITASGEHWFVYLGDGNPVIFETTGNVVDTYIERYNGDSYSGSNDNGGDGNNALYNFTTTSGTTYWIKVTARSATSGTYTFVVRNPE